ncbi:Putative zn(2)-C6 fungal-type DNA-binding domain-containing protein [Septoria linicola]|uniref:Zn(2)-C6 fungal-type DNA-binding domain-containing protein n=1 Tax=Septoria linicola TaxID=215465 RepID=A0A9Q9EGS5_9PEZI|nr:putative zn(2)-C6 fungal-type DNA-binding domain-containing protein [Septoria linicola]USW49142.1 Putative zn(2)-C6 fungal-type DNA-binding domain-containing protein [Septoria linicola]
MSAPPKKKLRKGTKSCVECRRRRCKCNYTIGDGDAPCDECIDRDTECVSQESVFDPSRASIPTRQRVERLESTVRHLAKDVAKLKGDTPGHVPPGRTPDYAFENTKRGSAGDGSDTDEEQSDSSYHGTALSLREQKNDPDRYWRGRLLSFVPSRDDVLLVTASATDCGRVTLVRRQQELGETSVPPGRVATWLIRFAVTFLHLPSIFDTTKLESIQRPESFVLAVVAEVSEYLSVDESIGTFEGIEAAAMLAQIQKFVGRPKKGWLTLRRAVPFAVLLGIPTARNALQQLHNGQAIENVQLGGLQAKARLWDTLCATDRLLCVPLGVASTTAGTGMAHIDPASPNAPLQQLAYIASGIADHIVKRNQIHDESLAYEQTGIIIQALRDLRADWPPRWSSLDHGGMVDPTTAPIVLFQSGHDFLVIAAEIPYMTKARFDARYSEHARRALRACRDVLRRYFALRTRLAVGAFLSRTLELHALTGCLILMLHRERQAMCSSNEDSALIENAKAAIKQAPEGPGAFLPVKMVECLNAVQQCLESSPASPSGVTVRVPILGAVDIRRGQTGHSDAYMPDFSVAVTHVPSQGVTTSSLTFDFESMEGDWSENDKA